MSAGGISSYVLTHGVHPHLPLILQRLREFSEEVLVVDSSGCAASAAVAAANSCAIHYRSFDDFRRQREYATALCRCPWIFYCDSDEVPSPELVEALKQLGERGPKLRAYRIRRDWYAFGRSVRGVYPVSSPDFPVRLVRKDAAVFESQRLVHERYLGHSDVGLIEQSILHYTFNSNVELVEKLQRYSRLEALSQADRDRSNLQLRVKQLLSPLAAFIQWYVIKLGLLDGRIGLKLSLYAAASKYCKYRHLLFYRSGAWRARVGLP